MNMPPGADDDAASDSSSLSSVQSPQNVALDEIRVANRASFPGSSTFAEGVVAHSTSAVPATLHTIPSTTPTPAEVPVKAKRVRKPKEPKVDGKDDKPKEKKPRKPREPKVKNEDGSAPAPRKRQKKEPVAIAPDAGTGPRQSTLTEMVNQFQTPGPPASAPQPQHILPSQPLQRQPDIMPRDSLPAPSKPPTPRPISSGQNFDPIRGSIMNSAPPPPSLTSNAVHSAHASPHINRASASPSINSLIDHPSKTSAPLFSSLHAPQQPGFVGSTQHSPTPPRATPILLSQPSALQQFTQAPPQPQSIPTMDGAMDVDLPKCAPQAKAQPSKSSSSAPTPQVQPKEKKAASPKAAGTGLLASNNLFGGPGAKQENDSRGPNIDIHITLNRAGGNTVNIAQEIMKKYGAEAINPRAAAHRAKLLQVAAAQNRLEGGSADDMSVDLMSDMDGDSNVEMGGMDDEGKSATGADDRPKKRRRKIEEYQLDDDFIDDTELAWEQKAAVAKDGFFVYSGKLVPDGTTADVEKAAPSGRGRGGGRGRGRGRGGASTASSTTAAAADKVKDPSAPARGRGSRGGKVPGAPRKPRITKAEKEKIEAEKAERERIIGNNHPPGGMPMQMSTTNSSTPASLVQPPQQPQLSHQIYTGTTPQGVPV